jgi:hypothetical protein
MLSGSNLLHPEVYILIIPAFGIISIIISGILQKIIFGNQSMIFGIMPHLFLVISRAPPVTESHGGCLVNGPKVAKFLDR